MSSPVPDPGAVPDSPDFDDLPHDPPRRPGEVPTAPDDPQDPPVDDGPVNSA